MSRFELLAAALMLFLMPNAWAQDDKAANMKRCRDRFIEATEPRLAGTAWNEILDQAGAGLSNVISDDNPSMALLAAWETSRHGPDTTSLFGWGKLTGFFQGRTRFVLPARWEICLAQEFFSNSPELKKTALKEYAQRTSEITSSDGQYYYTPKRLVNTAIGLSAPESVTLTKNDKELTIETGNKLTCTIPGEVLEREVKRYSKYDIINVIIIDTKCIIAIHDRFGSGFPLICIDLTSNKVLWRGRVWAMATEIIPVKTGAWWHEVTLARGRDSVIVFGAGLSCYIEEYKIDDGAPLLRFSSNTWLVRKTH